MGVRWEKGAPGFFFFLYKYIKFFGKFFFVHAGIRTHEKSVSKLKPLQPSDPGSIPGRASLIFFFIHIFSLYNNVEIFEENKFLVHAAISWFSILFKI